MSKLEGAMRCRLTVGEGVEIEAVPRPQKVDKG
jgi:hypothetical protein